MPARNASGTAEFASARRFGSVQDLSITSSIPRSLMTDPGTISGLTATEARRLIGERKLSPVDLLEACITQIEAVKSTNQWRGYQILR